MLGNLISCYKGMVKHSSRVSGRIGNACILNIQFLWPTEGEKAIAFPFQYIVMKEHLWKNDKSWSSNCRAHWAKEPGKEKAPKRFQDATWLAIQLLQESCGVSCWHGSMVENERTNRCSNWFHSFLWNYRQPSTKESNWNNTNWAGSTWSPYQWRGIGQLWLRLVLWHAILADWSLQANLWEKVSAICAKQIGLVLKTGTTWHMTTWSRCMTMHHFPGLKNLPWCQRFLWTIAIKLLSFDLTYFMLCTRAFWETSQPMPRFLGCCGDNIFTRFFEKHRGRCSSVEFQFCLQVCLYDQAVFGDLSFENFCETCFAELKSFCAEESKTLHMSGLSRTLLGFGTSSDYPTAKLCWILQLLSFHECPKSCCFSILVCPSQEEKLFWHLLLSKGLVQGSRHCMPTGFSRVFHWIASGYYGWHPQTYFPGDPCRNQCCQHFHEVHI